MFPYPSGMLHLGHLRVYTISDVLCRFYQHTHDNIIHPIGWDAFGLPAENAARDNQMDPSVWTRNNIAIMKNQLLQMKLTFDWSREIDTSQPDYFKWTQFIFLRLFQAGLVKRKRAIVNWDPVDKTVVANEQVLRDGRAERSGALVQRASLIQYFISITEYQRRLYDDLEHLDWPEYIKEQQRNWIKSPPRLYLKFDSPIPFECFTPLVNASASLGYITIGPEHPLIR